MTEFTRREAIVATGAAALVAAGAVPASARLAPTPGQTEGPFYPDKLPADTDNDLVRVEGQVKEAGGEIAMLAGRVLTPDGAPVSGALVEIWQCDANGRYLHSGDGGRAPRDAAFQGYGRMLTDAEGRYSFRTIKPVAYPGRTPHIHFKAHMPGGRVLTSQLYVAGDARNERDFIFRSLSQAERERVSAAFVRQGGAWQASFDIVLA